MEEKEVMLSPLDLFQHPPVQTSIIGNRMVPYKTLSYLDNQSSLEFSISTSTDWYIDLATIELELLVKLCKADGTNLSGDVNKQPGVVNNILHSLFDQCNVYINGTQVTPSDDHYAYRAYFENLLNYSKESAESHLACDGWVINTGENINKQDDTNVGFTKRRNLFANSKAVQLVGKLHGDIFSQSLYLMSGANLAIKLPLTKPSFYILEDDENASMLKILYATLHVTHYTISPRILMAHTKVLTDTSNAIYPYKRVEVKSFTVPAGSKSISHDNVILGTLPTTLLFAMVDNDAYVGKRSKNPFAFAHYSLTDFSLFIEGTQIPMHGLSMNFNLQKYWTRAYKSLFSGLGIHHANRGSQVTLEMFAHGFFILAFDLTPDLVADGEHVSLAKKGSARIDAKFEIELPNTITCLVYAVYNAAFEIDVSRNVLMVSP
ncbi:hypothetical protein J437_LFUL005848 [Ladona fulva]|uniref:Uncharacterized protein n=1 Tax=Ladona fulva TaxID=123851 RepID=A0A8K0K8M4_LADFU|nr:hypothetical protein J437_LFUL005848 [Ladona fulva]